MKKNDYVIVGGGTAGCVLANRLSANPKNNVVILEAGKIDKWWDVFIQMPAALTIPIGNKNYDWCYETAPEPYMNGRKVFHSRGKILGGCSTTNGMIFQRGNPLDYEKWGADHGMKKWDYAHCLPYFKKMENCTYENKDLSFRSGEGLLTLEKGPGKNPLFHAFLKATQEAGYPLSDDVNGYQQEGFGMFDRNIQNGQRMGASRAYYHPVKHRSNLNLITEAYVTKIIFEGKKAVGVEYRKGKKIFKIYGNDIILAGGAFNSPQLLQLSGIGDGLHLQSLGIPVVRDLKGVGENLQDHLEVYIQHACKQNVSMNPALKWWRKPDIGFRWLFFRKGPAATNHFEAGGFARSNSTVPYPNLMFHFLPLAVRYDGSCPPEGHGYQIHVGPMFSDVRGFVKIKSNDSNVYPHIQFNYLSTEKDRKEWPEAIKVSRKILSRPALEPYNKKEISPGAGVKTDDEILDWIAKDAETALHPCGTCKMGKDEMSVVDPDTLKVHGVEGLRVVDASIFPYVTNGNIHAPVLMLAEKASDIILGTKSLAPEYVDYYKVPAAFQKRNHLQNNDEHIRQ